MRNLVDNPDLQNRAVQLVSGSDCPVTVGFVAFNLGVHYLTARTILLTLLAQRRLEGERTTRGWIFRRKSEQSSLVSPIAQPASTSRKPENRQVERPKAQFNPVAKEESDPS